MKQTINIGANPGNLGDGDPIRTAFTKCNDNFDELYLTVSDGLLLINDPAPQVKATATGLDINGTRIFDNSGTVTIENLTVSGNTISTANNNASISLTTTGTGVTNINAANVSGGNINNTLIGASAPAQGKFLNLFSNNLAPNADATYTMGTTSARWSEVNTLLMRGNRVVVPPATTMTTAGTIDITKSHIQVDSTVSGGFTATLPNGAEGQLMLIVRTGGATGGGGYEVIVDPTSNRGFNTLTFNARGGAAMLLFSAGYWFLVSTSGDPGVVVA